MKNRKCSRPCFEGSEGVFILTTELGFSEHTKGVKWGQREDHARVEAQSEDLWLETLSNIFNIIYNMLSIGSNLQYHMHFF